MFLISVLVSTGMHFGFQLAQLSIPLNTSIIFGLLCITVTIGIRLLVQQTFITNFRNSRKPVAIYGAGEAGMKLLAALEYSIEYIPMVLIDDNPKLHGLKFGGLEVVSLETAEKRLKPLNVKTILIAMPSIKNNVKKKIIDKLTKLSVEIKSVPKFSDLIEGSIEINKVDTVSIDALLGRDIIPPIDILMSEDITSKTILITGAGGSIGTELCNQAILVSPKRLILFEQSEYNLYKLNNQIQEFCRLNQIKTEIVPILGLVQNKNKIEQILKTYAVDTIYHTAAYKHVPLIEMNVTEAILNNIKATHILAEAAHRFHIKKFILISSDKAVRPTNYMGASKRVSELICQAYAAEKGTSSIFSIVRFGNVLGSSGSVFPLFQEQILSGGPLTVTHPKITRYFMTITEAAQLVIQAGALGKGGEVFVLDMGKPVKIIDLAQKIVKLHGLQPYISGIGEPRDIEIKITGLRPGEKLYEELLIGDTVNKTLHKRIMAAHEVKLSLNELEPLLSTLYRAGEVFDKDTIKDAFDKLPIDIKENEFSNDTLLYR